MSTAELPSKRPTPRQLAEANRTARVRGLLRDLRGSSEYPLTVAEVAARLGESPADVLKLVGGKVLKSELLLAAKSPEAPVALRDDIGVLADSNALLAFAAGNVRAKRLQKGTPLCGTVKQFTADAGLNKPLPAALATALERRIATRSLPDGIAELILVVPSPAELAARFVALIDSQRTAPAGCYPVALSRLLGLAACDGKAKQVKAALKEAAFLDQVIVCLSTVPKEPAYVVAASLTTTLPTLVLAAFDRLMARSAAAATTLFTAKEIAAALVKDKSRQADFAQAIERAAGAGRLGAELAWLRDRGSPVFFRRRDMEPAQVAGSVEVRPTHHGPGATVSGEAAPPTAAIGSLQDAFADQFEAAFTRIDARTGHRNFVKVFDLRRELPQYSRTVFDAGLRQLRIADRYSMESAHGGAVRLTDEERQAGIQEGSSLLVYVSRKA